MKIKILLSVIVITAVLFTACKKSSNNTSTTTPSTPTSTTNFTRADYIWTAYSATDSDLTYHTKYSYNGTITAGTASNAILINYFLGSQLPCNATVSNATVTIPSGQSFYPTVVTNATGTMNTAGNVITITYIDTYNNDHHITVLTK